MKPANDASSRLSKYPILRMLLLGSVWFRVGLLVLMAAPLLVFLVVARMWRTSPAGFTPPIKVSVVDLIQSWSLQRSAAKATSKGQMDRAIYCWRMAAANNPGNPRLARGLLDAILISGDKRDQASLAMEEVLWLLRLSGTNQADLELTSRICERYSLEPLLLGLLQPREESLNATLSGAYLKALLRQGRPDEFGRFWAKASGRLPPELELPLFNAAHQAGWGPEEGTKAAWQQLEAALQRPEQRLLASQLNMMASFQRKDLPRYEKTFALSTNWQADRLVDHVNRWRLYEATTNKAGAKQLAETAAVAPSTASETLLLAETYLHLDLRQKAHRLLKQYVPEFGYSSDLWMFYASLLMADKDWDALLGLANQIRQERRVMQQLMAQSYFLEGYAEVAKQHRTQAQLAFNKVSEYELPGPGGVMSMASTMAGFGFPEGTRKLLLKHQSHFAKEPVYWNLLYSAAVGLKDEALLLSAAREMYTLIPTNWLAQYAYAAALITLRTQPEEAVRLTQDLIRQKPDHIASKINHSLALLQNRRVDEARLILKEIDPAKLDVMEANALYQAQFEAHLALQEYEQARQISTRLNRKLLFPTETKWYDQALEKISPGRKAGLRGGNSLIVNRLAD